MINYKGFGFCFRNKTQPIWTNFLVCKEDNINYFVEFNNNSFRSTYNLWGSESVFIYNDNNINILEISGE